MTTNIKDLNIRDGYIEIVKKWKTRLKIKMSNGKNEVIWTPKDLSNAKDGEIYLTEIVNYGNENQYYSLKVKEKIEPTKSEDLKIGQHLGRVIKINAILILCKISDEETVLLRANKNEKIKDMELIDIAVYENSESPIIGKYIEGLN